MKKLSATRDSQYTHHMEEFKPEEIEIMTITNMS